MSQSIRNGSQRRGVALENKSTKIQNKIIRTQQIPQGQENFYRTNEVGTPVPYYDQNNDLVTKNAEFNPRMLSDMTSAVPGEKRVDTIAQYNDGSGKLYGQTPNPFGLRQPPANYGKVILNDQFFDFLQKKRELELWSDFEAFKLSLVDTSNEPLREWWKKHHPELWEKKKKAYEDELEINKKFELLKLMGATTEEDLKWIYLHSLSQKGISPLAPQSRPVENRLNVDWQKDPNNGVGQNFFEPKFRNSSNSGGSSVNFKTEDDDDLL